MVVLLQWSILAIASIESRSARASSMAASFWSVIVLGLGLAAKVLWQALHRHLGVPEGVKPNLTTGSV